MTPRFGPQALHDDDQWRATREAQIEAAIACNRECFDDPDYCEEPERPRWLGVRRVGAYLAFIGIVALLCIVVVLAPIVAIAARVRGSMTP